MQPIQPDAGANAAPTPVAAPQAPIAATAVPDAQLGNRPGTAGNQFAQIASAASNLSQAVPNALAAAPDIVAPPTVVPSTNATQSLSPFGAVLASAPSLLPNAVSASTAVLTDATTASATAAPVLGRLPELTEPSTKDSKFGDTTQLSGFGASFQQQQVSPNAPTTTPAQTTATPATPAAQVAESVITHAHIVERSGTTEFHIRLDPPELGAVRIRLVNSGDGINGQVVVSDDAVRRMIESQLPELRQRLEAAGVSIQNFNVSTDTSSGSGSGTGSDRTDAPTVFGTQSAATSVPRLLPRPAARGSGSLDVIA